MARIPVVFRKAENRLVSYDAVDISSGRLVKTFYLGEVSGKRIMAEQKFYPDVIIHAKGSEVQPVAYDQVVKKEFKLTFGTTQTIQGDAIVSVPTIFDTSSGAQTNVRAYIEYICWKENAMGISGQVIARRTTKEGEYTLGAGPNQGSDVHAAQLGIPRTSFKVSESYVLEVGLWTKRGSAANYHIVYGADPIDRSVVSSQTYVGFRQGAPVVDWKGATSLAQIQLPFVVNL